MLRLKKRQIEFPKPVQQDDEDLFSIVKTTNTVNILDSEDSDNEATASEDENDKSSLEEESDSSADNSDSPPNKRSKVLPPPAWQDAEDDTDVNKLNLEKSVFGITPSYLKVPGIDSRYSKSGSSASSSESDDEDNDATAGSRVRARGRTIRARDVLDRRPSQRLKSGVLALKHCPDANRDCPASARVSTVRFHPRIPIAMTASMDTSLTLCKVDGELNEKVKEQKFKKYPVKCARFSPDGNQIILCSKFQEFKFYNLIKDKIESVRSLIGLPKREKLQQFEVSPTGNLLTFAGKYGHLYFIDTRSREKVCSTQVSGSIESMAFSHDGDFLYVYGDEGNVSVFDPRIVHGPFLRRWEDEGCVGGLSITAAPNNQWIACGSKTGVVNLYPWSETCQSSQPKPRNSILNLTTPCDQVRFNPTSEILAMSSCAEDRAVKLLHMGSREVFSNFPERGQALGCVSSLDFSPGGGYLAMGQHSGRTALYRLHHYPNY